MDSLRHAVRPIISLVADEDATIVGHILFTPVTLSGHDQLNIVGLGPMAVDPAHQRRGLGSALVREGLDRCRAQRYGAVVVLGHPEYYPRFGFVPASRFGIASRYEVPEEAFMALELRSGYLADASGIIAYHPAFDET